MVILLVVNYENRAMLQNLLRGLPGKVVAVTSLRGAERKFDALSEVDVIVLQPCIASSTPNTAEFITDIKRKGFSGKIVVVSDNIGQRGTLIRAGCTQACSPCNLFCTVLDATLGPTATVIR